MRACRYVYVLECIYRVFGLSVDWQVRFSESDGVFFSSFLFFSHGGVVRMAMTPTTNKRAKVINYDSWGIPASYLLSTRTHHLLAHLLVPAPARARDPLRVVLRLHAQLRHVPALLLQVRAELEVLGDDGVLADVRDEEHGEQRAEHAQRAADPERRLVARDGVGPACGADDLGEYPRADEGSDLRMGVVVSGGRGNGPGGGTYFADCGGDPVVLPADRGRAGLGCNQPDVVPRTELAECQE